MVIAQPDTDMLLTHDEQEAETLLAEKEQDMLLFQSQGKTTKNIRWETHLPCTLSDCGKGKCHLLQGLPHPVLLLCRERAICKAKAAQRQTLDFPAKAGISPICLCRTCLSLGQQRTLLI